MSAPLITAAAYGAALLATLALASVLTPAAWWRRPNARALAVVAAGTWAIGSLLAGAPDSPAPAQTAVSAAPLHKYQVFHALNLRDGIGINAKRVAVVPSGALVDATGRRQGDWWQVRADVGGAQVTGWASSLWLRRADEAGR